jgi:hypothetical protein
VIGAAPFASDVLAPCLEWQSALNKDFFLQAQTTSHQMDHCGKSSRWLSIVTIRLA